MLKIERLDGATPQAENRASPPSEAIPISSPPLQPVSPGPAATPQRFVTIMRPVKIKISFGETVLPRGMRLPIVSRDEQTVTVQYMGGNYAIPIASTDFR